MQISILVFGDVNIDTNVAVYGLPVGTNGIDISYVTDGVIDHIGGSAMNVAFALWNLGIEVKLISVIGNDFAGQYILKSLEEMAIKTDRILREWKNTPRSVILVDPEGTRYILHDSKEAMNYSMESINYDDLLKPGVIAHFSVVNWTRPIIKEAYRRKVITCTDLHTGFDIMGYHKDYIENAEILFFSSQGLPNWKEVGYNILSMGPKLVICMRGQEGCAVFREHFFRQYPPESFAEKIVDTVGAGDAMVGAFLACLARGMNLDDSIKRAQIAGLYACTIKGSHSFILTTHRWKISPIAEREDSGVNAG